MFLSASLGFKLIVLITLVNSSTVIRRKRYADDRCGKFFNPESLVFYGNTAKPNRWPFLVALFSNVKAKFFCGGSLISQQHILTAAHCLQEKRNTVAKKPTEVVAFLGKYDLNIIYERGAVAADPIEFFIHPDWKPLQPVKFDADIAIIALDGDVPLKENIYPVCLWTSSMESLEDDGIVVGWGTSEKQATTEHENLPHEVKLNIASKDDCYRDEVLAQVNSHRTFCAGGQGSGPCRGDSGGGLYKSHGDAFYIRGIVSTSFRTVNDECDVSRYSVFTDVGKFTDWIKSKMEVKIDLNCVFDYDFEKHRCTPRDLKILHGSIRIANVLGEQQAGGDGSDVFEIKIVNQLTPYLPAMISEVFPNLESYFVHSSKLKFIERRNFEGLNRVISVVFGVDNIKVIPKDAFYSLPSLKYLYLDNNQIESLDPDTFINNRDLTELYLWQNRITFLDARLFRKNLKLEKLDMDHNRLMFVDPQIFAPLKKLKLVKFTNNVCLSELFPDSVTLERLKEILGEKCKKV